MARITNKAIATKDYTKVYDVVPFTSFETGVFAVCLDLEKAAFVTDSKTVQLADMLRAEYGETSPTFAQYRTLQDALRLQALDAGFTGQAMRKHVAKAVKSVWGDLPASDSPEALAKRNARAIKAKVAKAKAEAAESADTSADETPVEPTTLDRLLTQFPLADILEACSKRMALDNARRIDSIAVHAIAEKLAA